jgi:hypothetical protein
MGIVDLTPQFAASLLESVVGTGLQSDQDEVVLLPSARRVPLFRQTGAGRPRDEERLSEDCRKLVVSRGERMRTSDGAFVDAVRLMEMEALLARKDANYAQGHILSLVRLAQDLADTAWSGMTAVENRSLHLLERRLSEMQNSERPARPEWVASCLSLLRSSEAPGRNALVDLMRYLEEVTGHPLVGFPEQAASDAIQLLLAIQYASESFAPRSPSLVPLDVCLGARCVLANSRTLHLRLGALLDHVLSPELPMWAHLERWATQIDHANHSVFCLPDELLGTVFAIDGRDLQPLDLVFSVVAKLDRTGKKCSVSESLVALERTLYRRIYRQESCKHHMAVLLRRVLDRALHEKHRSSMRLISPAPHAPRIGGRESDPPGLEPDDPIWRALRQRSDILEASRDRGCTPSVHEAWIRLFGRAPEDGDHPSDLDEFLRWALGSRSDLERGLAELEAPACANLAQWYTALVVRAAAIQAKLPGKVSLRRSHLLRTTPLLWFAAARLLVPTKAGIREMVTGPIEPGFLARADGHVPASLENWRGLHPWDCSLFGVWPPELRGRIFAEGIKLGVRKAQSEGVSASDCQVRLEMLTHELEYRSWLGAKERVALLERTLEPA